MKFATSDEMRETDRLAVEKYGFTTDMLIWGAAAALEQELLSMLSPGRRVGIVCGKGNNAADGVALAIRLHARQVPVRCFLLYPKTTLNNECLSYVERAERLGVQLTDGANEEALAECDIIVDAILGTGLTSAPHGAALEGIMCINRVRRACRDKTVLSVDIASGLEADTGCAQGASVAADRTVTFCRKKPGQLLGNGERFCGETVLYQIGLPCDDEKFRFSSYSREEAAGLCRYLQPDCNAHKGDMGRCLIIAGSVGYVGAACLAAQAAARTGAGLVTLAVPASIQPVVSMKLTAVMTLAVPDDGKGFFTPEGAVCIINGMEKYDSIAIGPGLGRNAETTEFLAAVLSRLNKPVVVDADGLWHLSRLSSIPKEAAQRMIVTPHPGEMGFLTGKVIPEITSAPVMVASDYAAGSGIVTLLKGHRSIVATPGGEVYINPTGCSGMATGGAGDVLTGIIAALLARGLSRFEAAKLGAYIHGFAGETACEKFGTLGMISEDLVNSLPFALKILSE